MVWLLPAALTGLAAVAGPIIIHLLRRQRARTVIVPTVRFVPAVDSSIVRLRTPADGGLLLLRMAIVACAALALARPLLLSDGRTAAWSERIARVVVVDASESVPSATAGESVRAEIGSATYAQRIDATEMEPALRRATAWLLASPPARREIVVVSDFQRGAVEQVDLDGVPGEIGIRFIPLRAPAAAGGREVTVGAVLSHDGALQRRLRIDEAATGSTFAPEASDLEGLRLLTARSDSAAAAALARVVARAGALAPSGSQPIIVRFRGGDALPPTGGESRGSGWAVQAALRLLRVADAANLPLTASAGANTLLVDVDAAPGTLLAAESLRAALDARADPRTLAEQEVARIPAETLQAWTREPGPADATAWRQSDESDGRWLWLAALILLGVETFVRRSSSARVQEVEARAA